MSKGLTVFPSWLDTHRGIINKEHLYNNRICVKKMIMKEYEIDYGSFIGGWYKRKFVHDLIELYQTSQHSWVVGIPEKVCDELKKN